MTSKRTMFKPNDKTVKITDTDENVKAMLLDGWMLQPVTVSDAAQAKEIVNPPTPAPRRRSRKITKTDKV